MSTRSNIAYQDDEGKIHAIYAHWDGYIEHNGVILHENYQDLDKVKELISLGSVSSLAPSIEKPAGHSFDSAKEGYTVFYHRDRGEPLQKPKVYNSPDEYLADRESSWAVYQYLYRGGTWVVSEYGKPFKLLSDEVAKVK